MYKLLLVTDRKETRDLFQDQIDWAKLNCRPPQIVETAEEGIAWLNSRAVDAVGYDLQKEAAATLLRYLRYGRPSMPIFEVAAEGKNQYDILKETVHMLDRLHSDFSDDVYDEEAMLNLMRDELVTRLLSGQLSDMAALERTLRLIRSRVDPEGRCILYEIDMPQGEVYLTEHHGHVQQRLESALRNNFFGRYVDGAYYAVAVLTPRHIRLVCVPMQTEEPEPIESFSERTAAHVRETIENIKEYLDLDMEITHVGFLQGLKELLIP